MPKQPKKKRGGQPGNQNACKHGFYAAGLAPEQVSAYWKNLKNGVNHEIAVIQARMEYALRHDPGNTRIFREVARSLAKYYIREFSLDDKSAVVVRKSIRAFIEAVRQRRLGCAAITPELLKQIGDFLK